MLKAGRPQSLQMMARVHEASNPNHSPSTNALSSVGLMARQPRALIPSNNANGRPVSVVGTFTCPNQVKRQLKGKGGGEGRQAGHRTACADKTNARPPNVLHDGRCRRAAQTTAKRTVVTRYAGGVASPFCAKPSPCALRAAGSTNTPITTRGQTRVPAPRQARSS